MKQSDAPTARKLLHGLLEQTKLETMRRIYVRVTPDDTGVIRSFMNVAGTETGRLSHAESFIDRSTNLANLPKKTAALDPLFQVRDCIVPHSGRLLGEVDYSRAEALWCAYMAGDDTRLDMYASGVDEYRWFVAMMEWEDADRWREVDKGRRDAIGKVGILSGQYGVGWRTLLHNVNKDYDLHGVTIDAGTAKRMEALIPELLPKTAERWREVEEEGFSQGYLVNPFGRRRDFFGRRDSQGARNSVAREMIAFGPQSANADAVNRAIQRVYRKYDPSRLRVLLTVHDSIVFDCEQRDMLKVGKAVKTEMEAVPREVSIKGRTVEIPAEVSFSSRNWAELKEVM